jgi:uncharacterized protein (TIGR00725 family)
MGAAAPTSGSYAAAEKLGRLVAERRWIVLTGGQPAGVMAAACAGAKQVAGSLTLGILPGTSEGASPDVDVAVFTGMGDARNVINVLSSDIIVACGVEGPGTTSEVALAIKAGKPVILLGASPAAQAFFGSIGGWLAAADPEEAVRLIEQRLEDTS